MSATATCWEDVYRVQTARIAELECENAALRELVGTLGAPNHINVPIEQWQELRADKERLDWLQSDCSCDLSWFGKEAPPGALTSLRNAIDWTRKEQP